MEVEIEAGTEDIFAEEAVFTSLVDSDLESSYSDRIFCTNVYPTFVCADCVSSDCHSFDEGVRVTFEDGTVHECTRVTFVGVTYNVLLVGNAGSGELPLSAGGETAAPSAAQAGVGDGLDNIFRSHFLQHLSQCEVTVHSDVFFDVFGVDNTAVPQCNSLLLLVESSVVQRGSSSGVFVFNAILVNQTVYDTALQQVFFYDFRDIIFGNHAVEGSFGVDDHDRAQSAQTETTGHNDLDFVSQTLGNQFSFQLVVQLGTAGRSTTGTAANQYMRTNHNCLFLLKLNLCSADGVIGNYCAALDVLFDHFLSLFCGHLNVCNLFLVLLVDFYNGFVLADADTTGLGYGYIVSQPCSGNTFYESVQHRTCAGSDTTGCHTNYNADFIAVGLTNSYLISHLGLDRHQFF